MNRGKQVILEMVRKENRLQYVDLLLLADENESVISKYIQDGEMFLIHSEGKIAGVVLYTFHAKQIVELKNIALKPSFRGEGLGRLVINNGFEIYKEKGLNKMIVGTANSSIGNLVFYQKVGFRMIEIKKDYFKQYPNPIFENGIRALDMVMFEKSLI